MARRSIAAAVLAMGTAAALVLGGSPAHAGEASATFGVSVRFADSSPEFGACKGGEVIQPQGVSAIVTCTPIPSTPAVPMPLPGERRGAVVSSVLFHISRGSWYVTPDESMGLGTVTSWRVVRIANRDYLEMMVGW